MLYAGGCLSVHQTIILFRSTIHYQEIPWKLQVVDSMIRLLQHPARILLPLGRDSLLGVSRWPRKRSPCIILSLCRPCICLHSRLTLLVSILPLVSISITRVKCKQCFPCRQTISTSRARQRQFIRWPKVRMQRKALPQSATLQSIATPVGEGVAGPQLQTSLVITNTKTRRHLRNLVQSHLLQAYCMSLVPSLPLMLLGSVCCLTWKMTPPLQAMTVQPSLSLPREYQIIRRLASLRRPPSGRVRRVATHPKRGRRSLLTSPTHRGACPEADACRPHYRSGPTKQIPTTRCCKCCMADASRFKRMHAFILFPRLRTFSAIQRRPLWRPSHFHRSDYTHSQDPHFRFSRK